jgi:glucodextranase-like protein
LTGVTAYDADVDAITWKNDRGGEGVALGTSSWSTSRIDLKTGQNRLTVTARDAAGNAWTAEVTVTRRVDLDNRLN